jgi:hypothetical protein
MFRIEQLFDSQILATETDRPVVLIVEPLDARILEAICHLTRYIRPVLLAGEKDVRTVAERHLGHIDAARIEYSLS